MKKMFIAMSVLFSLMITSVNAVEVTVEEKITGLYVGYFNRAADQKGLDYWTAKAEEVARQGGDVSSVFIILSGGFATHPTFKSTYGNLNNKAFIEAIYRNALGRDGDAQGIAYWTDLIDRGMLRSDMVATFVELSMVTDLTPENYPSLSTAELAAAQLRQDLITNKVTVALAFTKQMDTLSNVVDNQHPESDPAYLASIMIISGVTEAEATVWNATDFLEGIIGDDDPIGQINASDSLGGNVVGIKLILLDGNDVTVYKYADYYDDPGYSAESSYDPSVDVVRNGSVDTDVLGSYTLTYVATDGKGNTRTVTRTVEVVKNPNINVQSASTVTQFRKALENASVNGKDDVILLASGTYRTIEDGQGTFDFNDNEAHWLRIYGVEGTIIDGANTDRVLDFDNTNDGSIILKHLDVRNGQENGISSEEYLILVDCKVHDNIGHGIYAKVGMKAVYSGIYNNIHVGDYNYVGGGIYSDGETRIYSSRIYNNTTEYRGGGIYSKDNLIIGRSEVYGNIVRYDSRNVRGGGIYISGGDYSIIYDTAIHHNVVAHGDGGGIYHAGGYDDRLDIYSSQIYANKAANKAGGIYIGSGVETLNIEKSEVKDNNATEQGGIYAKVGINMHDSNVTGNLSTNSQYGGGIYIDDQWGKYDSVIASSIISNNTIINDYSYSSYKQILGVGIYIYNRKSFTIENSVIANNKAILSQGGNSYGVAVCVSDSLSELNMFNNTIVNNITQGADNTYGAIYGKGNFHNNIIDSNDGTINFRGNSNVYNNYVDYSTFVNENTYTVIKKENIVPQAGDTNYNADFTLPADSILINQGATPRTSWWGDPYYDNMDHYDAVLENLEKDIVGNLRDDGIVDMGAYEYQE